MVVVGFIQLECGVGIEVAIIPCLPCPVLSILFHSSQKKTKCQVYDMNFCYHPNEKSFSQEMFCSLIVIIVPFWRGWDESLLEKLFNSITVPHNILFL